MRRLAHVIFEQVAAGPNVENPVFSPLDNLVKVGNRRFVQINQAVGTNVNLKNLMLGDAVDVAVATTGQMDNAVRLGDAHKGRAIIVQLPAPHHPTALRAEGKNHAVVGGSVHIAGDRTAGQIGAGSAVKL